MEIHSLDDESISPKSDLSSPTQVALPHSRNPFLIPGLFNKEEISESGEPPKTNRIEHINRQEEDCLRSDIPENEENTSHPNKQHSQMEDAVTKARFIAAQQLFLQHLQKRKHLLLTATQLRDNTLSENADRKSVAAFPPSLFPFSFQGTPLLNTASSAALELPKFDIEALGNGMSHGPEELYGDIVQDKKMDPLGQTENILMLFTQIQNYRRHLHESGAMKFPFASNSSRFSSHDNVVKPF